MTDDEILAASRALRAWFDSQDINNEDRIKIMLIGAVSVAVQEHVGNTQQLEDLVVEITLDAVSIAQAALEAKQNLRKKHD